MTPRRGIERELERVLPGAVRWLDAAAEQGDVDVIVPGLRPAELRRASALGGIARCLAGQALAEWPPAVRAWAEGAASPPAALVEQLRAAPTDEWDPVAGLYELAVSGPSRRVLGTFFTPPAVVQYMLREATRLLPSPATVVDPGAGVGAFASAAALLWGEAEIVAVDVNAVTLGLLAARETNRGSRLRLILDDFLRWAPTASADLKGPRLWIGNPPYTRHQSMPEPARESARRLATPLVTSGHAGLSAYFLASILEAIDAADAVCLLLPGSWIDARYGRLLRIRLETLKTREVRLIGFAGDRDLFPGTRVNGMILLIGPEQASAQAMWTARAEMKGSTVDVSAATEHARHPATGVELGNRLWPRQGASAAIAESRPLSSIARVRRGVATGANRFFLFTDDDAAGMPREFLRCAVHRLRDVEGETLDQAEHDRVGTRGGRRWLLELPVGVDLESHAGLAEWRDRAHADVMSTHLGSHREAWYAVEHVDPPDLLVAAMGKGRFRAVLNSVGAVHLNALYGVYVRDPDPRVAARLCSWINSGSGQHELAMRARAYGRQLLKLEPRDLGAVPVPAHITDGHD